MAEQNIPGLERLFDYGTINDKTNPREYRFYNFEGEQKDVNLGDGDRVSKNARCPRDGVRIVSYSGEPHNVAECPNCGYSHSRTDYLRENDLARLTGEIKKIEIELAKLKVTRQVVSNPNHLIVQANLRDDAMKR